METKTFEDGDVVRLNSGGPDMTVVRVNEDNSVDCVWSGSNDHTFNPATLTKVSPRA
jgi:uncharacterized protein YodC (DUF2158 family)